MQLFCAVLLSLLIGTITFSIGLVFGNTFLDKTVYSSSFTGKMSDKHFLNLQSYVESEGISADNIDRLDIWFRRGHKVYLTLYQGDELIYESPLAGEAKKELNGELSPELESSDSEYTLTLSDGDTLRAFLYYYASEGFYFWMVILFGIIAFLAFSLSFTMMINRKISYLTLLTNELDILSGGQLEYPVTVKGRDEISELATGIDEMRRSIRNHQEIEEQIRSANSELITAISHDLRTPLTSLLAYLEIIERKKYSDEEQMNSLIHKSIGQTMRIKNMADKLFEYFLAYSTEWEASDMETLDADLFLRSILEDYSYALESNGFTVRKFFSEAGGSISVNPELIQRVFDNLYSNLLKYADTVQSIKVSYGRADDNLLLSIENGVKPLSEAGDSTGIGLKTCRRIVEYHGGDFSTIEEDGKFFVSMKLPIS